MIDALEIVVISFVLEDVAISFNLGSVGKGIIGSASFLGRLPETGGGEQAEVVRAARVAFVPSVRHLELAR